MGSRTPTRVKKYMYYVYYSKFLISTQLIFFISTATKSWIRYYM